MSAPLDGLLAFFRLLRVAGLRVGLSETEDALRALAALEALTAPDKAPEQRDRDGPVSLGALGGFKAALKATLVKRQADVPTFDRVFDLFFGLAPPWPRARAGSQARGLTQGLGEGGAGGSGGGGAARYERARDRAARFIVRHVYAPARPDNARSVQEALVLLSRRVQRQSEADRPLQVIRQELERAFLAVLPAPERGPALEALVGQGNFDEVDFGQMDESEAALIEEQIEQLVEALRVRLRRRTRPDRRGRVDLRRTLRQSLQYGGVPVRLARRRRRVEEPQLFVLADLSGSVAAFSRFFLMLTRAFQGAARTCRTFGFVDRLWEITQPLKAELERTARAGEAVSRLLARWQAQGWTARRTDYGSVLAQFERLSRGALNRRTTVVILGDARTNRAPPRVEALERVRQRVKGVIWLNPERRARWDTGDSVQSLYAPHCAQVLECRNLAQLRRVIRQLVLVFQ